jgi:hypothetical protein
MAEAAYPWAYIQTGLPDLAERENSPPAGGPFELGRLPGRPSSPARAFGSPPALVGVALKSRIPLQVGRSRDAGAELREDLFRCRGRLRQPTAELALRGFATDRLLTDAGPPL